MKYIKSFLNFIFNPLSSTLMGKFPDGIVKVCSKRPVIIFFVSLLVTAGIILYIYRSIIF